MSYANRKRKYELYKDTPKLSDALKREFEGENAEELAAREAKEKEIAEKKLKEEDQASGLDEVATPGAHSHHHHHY